jgi:hypothetical protein
MEIAMIKTLLVFGTALGLVAATGVASAGTCTMEIDKLQKQLSSSDAGMGPTGTGQVAETGQELHPPTDTMNKATGNKAASSDDVANQNVGQPTDAEAAQSGEFGACAAVRSGRQRIRLHGGSGQGQEPPRRSVSKT